MPAVREAFRRIVLRRPWATFLVMGLAFLVFGIDSINLVHLITENARFLLENGWMAVVDGGLWQLLGLLVNAYVAMVAYVVLKTCEHTLSDWLGGGRHEPAEDSSNNETRH